MKPFSAVFLYKSLQMPVYQCLNELLVSMVAALTKFNTCTWVSFDDCSPSPHLSDRVQAHVHLLPQIMLHLHSELLLFLTQVTQCLLKE